MNISVTKQEAIAVEKATGRRMLPATLAYLERARLAYMNLGGEGQLPAAVLICAMVETGAMDDAYDENAQAQQVAAAKAEAKVKAKATAAQADAGITVPSESMVDDTSLPTDGLTVGQLCNYQNGKGAWLSCRYLAPGTQPGHVLVRTADDPEPIEVPLGGRFDVPNLAALIAAD